MQFSNIQCVFTIILIGLIGIKSADVTNVSSQERNSRVTRKIHCLDNEFHCDDGNCISTTKVCDGENDCDNGNDETKESCRNKVCGKDEFQCLDGKCINKMYRCNNYVDCRDMSDEFECLNSISTTLKPILEQVTTPKIIDEFTTTTKTWFQILSNWVAKRTAEELITPETTTEELITPETTTEELITQETTAEELITPETTAEELITPKTTTEELITPEVTVEELITPEKTAKELITPEVTVEELITPEKTAKELITPEVTVEELITPEKSTIETITSERTTEEIMMLDTPSIMTPVMRISDKTTPKNTSESATSKIITPTSNATKAHNGNESLQSHYLFTFILLMANMYNILSYT